MKNSYFRDDSALKLTSEEESDDESIEETDDQETSVIKTDSSSLAVQNMIAEFDHGQSVLAQAESRAFIPPLEVNLDDIEQCDIDNVVSQSQEHIDEADKIIQRKQPSSKKDKEKRYMPSSQFLQFFPHFLEMGFCS